MKHTAVFVTILLPIFLIIFCNTESFAQNRINSKNPVYTTTKSVNTNTLEQWVQQESYSKSANNLKQQVAEVKKLNDKKTQISKKLKSEKQTVSAQMAIEDYKLELELFRAELVLAIANQFKKEYNANPKTTRSKRNVEVAKLIGVKAYAYNGLPTKVKTNLPNRIPQKHVNSLESLDKEITKWGNLLSTMGEDGQLFNLDLQGALQNQQQTLQTMSNINKLMHDTASSIIRKID